MYTPTKKTKKSGIGPSHAIRQSPQHQHSPDKHELLEGRAMSFLPAYVCLLRHEAQKVSLSVKAKYPVPLPPMSKDVEMEGSPLVYINDLKYQDYNLLDHNKFP